MAPRTKFQLGSRPTGKPYQRGRRIPNNTPSCALTSSSSGQGNAQRSNASGNLGSQKSGFSGATGNIDPGTNSEKSSKGTNMLSSRRPKPSSESGEGGNPSHTVVISTGTGRERNKTLGKAQTSPSVGGTNSSARKTPKTPPVNPQPLRRTTGHSTLSISLKKNVSKQNVKSEKQQEEHNPPSREEDRKRTLTEEEERLKLFTSFCDVLNKMIGLKEQWDQAMEAFKGK